MPGEMIVGLPVSSIIAVSAANGACSVPAIIAPIPSSA